MAAMRFTISLLFLMLPLCAQPPQEGKKGGERPAPKNLKVLTAEQVMPSMMGFTRALGVRCDYCHMGRDFASDENPKKATARMMITLAHDVNAKFPDGKAHVTCYTCHHGKTMPETEAPPAAAQQ